MDSEAVKPKPQESHIISITTGSGQEIVGLIRQPIESPFLKIENACFIVRQPNKITALSSAAHEDFRTKTIYVSTAGTFIIELGYEARLIKLWKQANSNIVLPQSHIQQVKAVGMN